jgi:hypothetical protein
VKSFLENMPHAVNIEDCPAFTDDLNAALTLRPQGWTVANLGEGDDGSWWCVMREGYLTSYGAVVLSHLKCATPALALTAACLRALASQAGETR